MSCDGNSSTYLELYANDYKLFNRSHPVMLYQYITLIIRLLTHN